MKVIGKVNVKLSDPWNELLNLKLILLSMKVNEET